VSLKASEWRFVVDPFGDLDTMDQLTSWRNIGAV
jgi:hypothetical protein